MISPKITLVKSPSTGNIEVIIHDSVYMMPDRVLVLPTGGIVIEDPAEPYRERIAQLEHELAKAKRGKKHILRQLSGNSG
jgi:hypothetical protein